MDKLADVKWIPADKLLSIGRRHRPFAEVVEAGGEPSANATEFPPHRAVTILQIVQICSTVAKWGPDPARGPACSGSGDPLQLIRYELDSVKAFQVFPFQSTFVTHGDILQRLTILTAPTHY
jgi:hypothetical protein